MFIFTPPQRTAVFLARMVMPFSRSRSPESITRSVSSWWAPNAPVWRSSASTRVVLPWSTCATMATFLMSSRVSMGGPTIDDLGGVPSGGRRGATFRRRPAPAPPPPSPRVRTAGSGSTRTRWPESGHHPTTRPGTSSPRRRERLDQGHQGELGPHRVAARPGQHDEVRVRRCARRPARAAPAARNGGCPTSGPGR